MARTRHPVRRCVLAATSVAIVILTASPALACGGLVAPNGTINLVRTTTLAAYHRGIEHYITSFEFAGRGEELGSIIPLPGVPTKVVKGGDWTLQRLQIEVAPPALELAGDGAAAVADRAEVLLETEIDALDITVLKGGAEAVGSWATEHGFFLPPDAPEVLEFYAERSPIFLAARFNARRAADQDVQVGEGTPIHVVIPTPRPWVPLRILALGRRANEIVEADVFLLTDAEPSMLPQAIGPDDRGDQTGLILQASEPASDQLMNDLRSDDRMGWLPEHDMWLTAIRVRERADLLTHDLSIDASGVGEPDPVAAGLVRPLSSTFDADSSWPTVALAGLVAALVSVAAAGVAYARSTRAAQDR
jgi:Uncharacterized protein conserved in bacteria (DUF2330)